MHLPNLSYFSSVARHIRSNRGCRTILLVDDDPTVLIFLETMLKNEGYKVVTATDPSVALDIAGQITFDMLITDFQMPGMNGFTLATQIVRNRATLPVLLISASELEQLPMPEISARHWSVLPKPLDRECLMHRIDYDCLGWAKRLHA